MEETPNYFTKFPQDIRCSSIYYLTTIEDLTAFFSNPRNRSLRSCVIRIDPGLSKIIDFQQVLPYSNVEVIAIPLSYLPGDDLTPLTTLRHLREATLVYYQPRPYQFVFDSVQFNHYLTAMTLPQLSQLHLSVSFGVDLRFDLSILKKVESDPIADYIVKRRSLIGEWTGGFRRITYGPILNETIFEEINQKVPITGLDFTFHYNFDFVPADQVTEITLPSVDWKYLINRQDRFGDIVVMPVNWSEVPRVFNRYRNVTDWRVAPDLPIDSGFYIFATYISVSFERFLTDDQAVPSPIMKALHFPIHSRLIRKTLQFYPNLTYLQVLVDGESEIPTLFQLASVLRYTIFTTFDLPEIPNAEVIRLPLRVEEECD